MRTRDKNILVGGAIGFGFIAIVDILLQWFKHNEENKPFTWESYNGMQTLKKGFFGFVIGAGTGYLTYKYKVSEESKLPFSSDEYLRKLLTSESLKSKPSIFQKVLLRRERVKQLLTDRFHKKLVAPPEDSGSFHKRTAIASNYDLDIIVPFKKTSFNNLENMFEDVHEVIDNSFGHEATVTKQTKAISIAFDEETEPVYFDIVPGREINNYKNDKLLNLYVRPEWIWQRGSSFKTNVQSQQKLTKNKPQARTVIKLLKCYRDKNGFELSGPILEQCVIETLSNRNYGVHPSTTENLLNCMEYLSKKITQKTVIDYSNTNNNLNEKFPASDREAFADQLITDIKRIENNPRYIREIFEA
ncbi:MAG: hypothetical protein JNM78_06155 [Cyclobacteriaceae bacterium]|nr:hypothetical protein [Cyclobacteriaceae bacterium]